MLQYPPMIDLLQTLGSGILIGLVYALLGLCIVVVYRTSKVYNFAIGQLMVIGSFLFYLLLTKFGLPLFVSLPGGLLAAGLAGAIVERLTIKPMGQRDPVMATLATIGLSIFLGACVKLAGWAGISPGWQPLELPDISIGGRFLFLSQDIWAGLLCLAAFLLVVFFLFRTKWGLAVRAVSESQVKATAFGIDARLTLMLAWAVSTGCVTLAGVMISNFGVFSTSIAYVGIRALPVVFIGGLDSIVGALLGGIIVGVCESLVASYIEPLGLTGFKDVSAYLLVLVVLVFRPHGLFGTVRIERV